MGDNCLHTRRNDGAVRPPDAQHWVSKHSIHQVGTRAQDACNTPGKTPPPIPQKADAIRGKAGSRLEALKDAWRMRKASVDDLWRYAQDSRVATVMRPYMEAVAHE